MDTVKSSEAKIVNADFKVPVLVNSDVLSQIFVTHHQCKKGDEWSGLLIYKILEGGLDNLKDLKIECVGLYPLDHGTPTFTSFEAGPDWFKAFKQYPMVDPVKPDPTYRIGKIHSHNTMGVFHSGTDNDDLRNSAPNFPMFLSLIVNYACEFDCKLAIAMESTTETKTVTKKRWRLKGATDYKEEEVVAETKSEPTDILVINCEPLVYYDAWLIEQNKALKVPKPTAFVTHWNPATNQGINVSTNQNTNANPNTNLEVPKWMYTQVLDNFGDLISLGHMYGEPATEVLKHVDHKLQVKDLPAYTKALKVYFALDWMDSTFPKQKNILASEVIACIFNFITIHKNLWIHQHLRKTFNELYQEHHAIRKVQGGRVVPNHQQI